MNFLSERKTQINNAVKKRTKTVSEMTGKISIPSMVDMWCLMNFNMAFELSNRGPKATLLLGLMLLLRYYGYQNLVFADRRLAR